MQKNRTRPHHKDLWTRVTNGFATAATIVAATFVASAAGIAGADEFPSLDPTAIDLNTIIRSLGGSDSPMECFETYAPSAGTLVLEAIVSSEANWEARVTSLHPASDSFEGAPHRTLLALPHIQVVDILAAGDYRFCIAVQDPRQRLGEYKVFTAFDPTSHPWDRAEDPEEEEPNPEPFMHLPLDRAEDPEEEEPNPEPFMHQPLDRAEDPEEEEPNPEPFMHQPLDRAEDPEEEEPNPEPFTVSEFLCRNLVEDDLADSFACATGLLPGRNFKGELWNPRGDDSDVFTFILHRMQTLEVSTFGPVDTHGALYDHQGQRLALDDDGGEGTNFRIVRTLVPGRYFLRVEGHGAAEGPYVVSLTELYRP